LRHESAAFAALTMLTLVGLLNLANVQQVSAYETTFYFHNYRELSISLGQLEFGGFQVSSIETDPSSTSARAYADVTPDQPNGGGSSPTLSSLIYVSGQHSGYAAVVAWFTTPFTIGVSLDGDVVMHVWMSSNDGVWPWEGSEYFMGIGDYSPGTTVPLTILWTYTSNAAAGNVFTNSPTEYTASLHISQHEFQPGSMLTFFAGAASKKQGYQFTVHFDSPSWSSRAEIPADPSLTVPEFDNLVIIVVVAITLIPLFRNRLESDRHGKDFRNTR